jgi:hypothetical protein
MSEADITEQMVMMMDLTLAGVSVLFSIVSAYIVALFYLLNRAPFGLKMTAFAFFTLTMLFLAAFAANCFSHAASLQAALVELATATDVSPIGEAAVRDGLVDRSRLDQTIRWLSWAGMALIYAALTYFTFVHRWRRQAPADPTG